MGDSKLVLNGTAVTATGTELNKLDGVTATTAELNCVDGLTATTAELNYVDGVTSNIQTQLDSKGSGDITGVTAGTNLNGGGSSGSGKGPGLPGPSCAWRRGKS